jgi:RNA-directed DNA polymerase
MERRLKGWLERRDLKLNEAKTRRVNAREEGFEFLGWRTTPRKTKRGTLYYHMEPSTKSRGKLMDKVRAILSSRSQQKEAVRVVGEVNRVTRGWSAYFRPGHSRDVFRHMHEVISARLRTWLWRKHRRSKPKHGYYTKKRMQEQYGLYNMATAHV